MGVIMTGKERVKRAITFQGPDRVPFTLPEFWGSDMLSVDIGGDPDLKPVSEGEDEWGCMWTKVSIGDNTMGQVTGHPLDDYSKLAGYVFPDYTKQVRYEDMRKVIQQNSDGKFVLASLPISLNHRLEYLRGPENAWTDPYLYPNELSELLERITCMGEAVIQKYVEMGGIDGIFWCDDWGLQDRTMVSPAIFREFFKPYYARIFKKAHENGILTLLHSCGNIMEILDDFIEAGLDVIQMDQQENMGLENLRKRFGGRICFWSPVDIQKTMIEGSVDEVKAYARKLIDTLGSYNGGFIAQWYASPQAVQHTQEKIDAMCETFVTYGRDFYKYVRI